VIPLV